MDIHGSLAWSLRALGAVSLAERCEAAIVLNHAASMVQSCEDALLAAQWARVMRKLRNSG